MLIYLIYIVSSYSWITPVRGICRSPSRGLSRSVGLRLILFSYYLTWISRRTCNQGLGGITLQTNGQCENFNIGFNGIQVAGGGSDSCFLQLYHGRDCQDFIETNIGPINDPNLSGCIGPFDINGSGFTDVLSGRIINCPT
jgi:hypothetical protein